IPGSPVPAFYRFANGYLYATLANEFNINKESLLAPAKVFPANRTDTLSVVVNIDEVPANLRDAFLGQLDLRLADAKEEKQPNETEAQKAFRVATIEELGQQLKALVKEGKALELALNVDQQ